MKKVMSYAKEFFHRADIFLLVMGLICAIFGIVVISSATASYHSAKYVIVQSASLILGVIAFVVMTVLDVDVLADKWQILCAFNVVFLLLLIPFGVSDNTGNTGWLRFFGIGIQPTEVVKLTFIVILAKQISYLKEYHDLNSVWSVAQLAGHFVLLFGLILVAVSYTHLDVYKRQETACATIEKEAIHMKRGYLYIAVTTLLFSSMEVALKLISGQFNPIQLNFSRFVVGGLVLIPFAVRELKKRGLKLDGKALGSFALLGLMGIAVSMSLYQLSVTRIQASVVGVLFSSNPVFVTLFAFLLLHETISKNQIAGLVLDVAGIVLIIQPWHLRLDALGVVSVSYTHLDVYKRQSL